MNEVKLRNGIIQIATPYSTGTGFLLADYQLIVTNEHVVRDNREVVIYGANFRQQIVEVLYLDEKYDLAFLAMPVGYEGGALSLAKEMTAKKEQIVYAVGHPYGMDFTVEQGNILELEKIFFDLPFIHHTALLNPGYSGGPLVNEDEEVIGINTFITRKKKIVGLSLPISQLKKQYEAYQASGWRIAATCGECGLLVCQASITAHQCPNCQHTIQLSSNIARYEPTGMSLTIEDLLAKMDYDPILARRGPNNWDILKGSAHINISYYEKSGLIIGDSYLCSLPQQELPPLYKYLLEQNYLLEGLTLSIKGKTVVLSLLIYDRYLNQNTGMVLFSHLFKTADDLDNILVEEYGATWIKEPPTITKGEEENTF